MYEIGHHVLRDFSVELDKQVTEVEEMNPLAVVELVERLVDLQGFARCGWKPSWKGKMPSKMIFVSGSFVRSFSTTAVTPANTILGV